MKGGPKVGGKKNQACISSAARKWYKLWKNVGAKHVESKGIKP